MTPRISNLMKRLEPFSIFKKTFLGASESLPSKVMKRAESATAVLLSANHARPSGMISKVLPLAGAKNKIADSIVAPDSVSVVDDFARLEESSKMPLHDQPVFVNSLFAKRMKFCRDSYVAVSHENPASFVSWALFRIGFPKQISACSATLRRPFEMPFLAHFFSAVPTFCKFAFIANPLSGLFVVYHTLCKEGSNGL